LMKSKVWLGRRAFLTSVRHLCIVCLEIRDVFMNNNIEKENKRTWIFFLLFIILLLYWGYIVTFTNILTIYPSLIHPPIVLLYPSSHYSLNSFNMSHFSIFIHVYIIFLQYSASFTLSLYPLSSHWYQPPKQDLFYLPVPHFWKKKCVFVCLR
jgi:hypothetical protein